MLLVRDRGSQSEVGAARRRRRTARRLEARPPHASATESKVSSERNPAASRDRLRIHLPLSHGAGHPEAGPPPSRRPRPSGGSVRRARPRQCLRQVERVADARSAGTARSRPTVHEASGASAYSIRPIGPRRCTVRGLRIERIGRRAAMRSESAGKAHSPSRVRPRPAPASLGLLVALRLGRQALLGHLDRAGVARGRRRRGDVAVQHVDQRAQQPHLAVVDAQREAGVLRELAPFLRRAARSPRCFPRRAARRNRG